MFRRINRNLSDSGYEIGNKLRGFILRWLILHGYRLYSRRLGFTTRNRNNSKERLSIDPEGL
jgi:hypothetical protein